MVVLHPDKDTIQKDSLARHWCHVNIILAGAGLDQKGFPQLSAYPAHLLQGKKTIIQILAEHIFVYMQDGFVSGLGQRGHLYA